jgi:hypothetical protein
MPTEKITLNTSGYVAKNVASLDKVVMPVPEETIDHLDYTFTEMDTYSDLNYLTYNANAGMTYTFRPGLSWLVEANFYGIDDRLGYVYGNESGTLLVIRSGVKIDF